jgi:hypothetical protein
VSVQAPLQRDADLREDLDRAKQANTALMLDVQNLQTDLLAKNREITRLKTELDKVLRKHTPTNEVEGVFEHFLSVVWSGKGRRPKLDGARQRMIRDRLRDGFTVAELRQALGGLARFPNVADNGRCVPGKGKRYADLKHALKDASTVERFIDYLEGPVENVVPLRRSEFREVEARSGEEFCDALTDLGLKVVARHGYGASRWMAACPAHEDRDPSLSISELNDGKVLLRCFAGCETDDVLAAVGWTFSMLRGRS